MYYVILLIHYIIFSHVISFYLTILSIIYTNCTAEVADQVYISLCILYITVYVTNTNLESYILLDMRLSHIFSFSF